MIGQKTTALTLFTVSCLTAVANSKPFRAWSPYTWMRDKEDPRLTASIKEFFHKVKEGEDADKVDGGEDGKEEEEEELI